MKDFFSKYDQIRRKLRIWSHLLKKPSMENFIFCAVLRETIHHQIWYFLGNWWAQSLLTILNPFDATELFLYPLKRSENAGFLMFSGSIAHTYLHFFRWKPLFLLKVHWCRSENLQIYLSSHKNYMPKVSHYSSIYFLSYAHPRYMKCLFTNIQKQYRIC